MEIERQLADWIEKDYELNVISRQQLLLKYLEYFFENENNEEKITVFNNKKFYRLCDYLINEKILMGFNHSSRGYAYFIKRSKNPSSEMAISALYPLGFLSHLTAMNLYGIGTTKSTGIYITCPNRVDWKNLCLKKIKNRFKLLNVNVMPSAKDYTSFNNLILSNQAILDPYPHQSVLEEAGSTKPLIIVNRKNIVESEWWNHSHIQNIVDLYIDMLRSPHYCGGISHVLFVYKEQLLKDKELLFAIIDSLNNSGTIIDRARFGYIFDKILNINSSIILKWKEEQKDKRGSSRKLFSNFDFNSFYDEDWNISINNQTIINLHKNLHK